MPTIPTRMPAEGPAMRQWLYKRLAEHTNTATSRPWSAMDIAAATNTTPGLVSLVCSGQRRTGTKTAAIQHRIAKVLDVTVGDLFGHICKQCVACGAPHQPRRANPRTAKI